MLDLNYERSLINMKFISKEKAITRNNSKDCVAIEYPIGDQSISFAIIELKGKYPDNGFAVNTKCKELVYVMKGKGKLVVGEKVIKLKKGDLVLLYPEERFYWQGTLTLLMPCTPAWYLKQHKIIKK